MGVGGIGSTTSFWQDDQSYWSQQQGASSSSAASTALINAIGSAETSLGKGLASIANSTALKRVNSQLMSDIQSLLSGNSSTGSGSTSSSTSSSYTAAKPATGTGKASLSISTPLSLLGIPAGGSITVSAGGNTTTYASTGSDTVGDLMNAINADYYGNAQVTASLNSSGNLVLTSKNTSDEISVNGVYAGNIGFGIGNDTFKATPAQGTPPSTASSTPSTTTSSSSTTSTKRSYTTAASESASSASSLLAASGVAGSVVNLLA